MAAAYRTLRQRGLVKANGRRGTVVTNRPTLLSRPGRSLPPNTRDLARGNPDPALLPPLDPALRRLDTRHRLYGEPAKLERLVELARADFAQDGVAGEIAIAGGALDGIERALQSRLHPGDRVVVEDPTWPRITDLVPEDIAICKTYRSLLEQGHGIRFAPAEVACRFSFETLPPPAPTLGFHGLTHLVRIVNMSEEELASYRPEPMLTYEKR